MNPNKRIYLVKHTCKIMSIINTCKIFSNSKNHTKRIFYPEKQFGFLSLVPLVTNFNISYSSGKGYCSLAW